MTVPNVSDIAIGLLLIRLVSVFYVIRVMRKQLELFRLHIDTGLVRFRKTMFALSTVFLISSIMPIAVDTYYGFFEQVDDTEDVLIILYAVSNALMSLAASIILWTIYKIAAESIDE